MRAVLCRAFGPFERLALAELPSPPITPETVRVAVHSVGVNFADLLIVQGKYQEKPALPFSPGFEIAGVVTELGPSVAGLMPGQRVFGIMDHGAYADEAVLPAARVYPIPDSMDFAIAAGFPVAYGTSHGALDWRARLKPGETLLVLGAAGGVGLTAVEIGKAMGATVIAVASGPEKLAVARAQGADHLIDYSREDLRGRIKELTDGRGPDVIYDPVGGDAFDQCLRSIAWGGRFIVIGFASGRIPQIPANLLLVKNCDAIGFYWGSYRARDPALVRRSFETLLGWFAAGKLRPHVSHRIPLAEAGRAMALLAERKATGKVVLTTGR
ncbi:MAG TPA: NADPH:quinone oxidoreductase family protein [Stellaceae bacterium]|nr:NADPH:quinone oxidoreductase family protein [Stellaceae bacterium]